MTEVMVSCVTGPVTGEVALIEVVYRMENTADGIGWEALGN